MTKPKGTVTVTKVVKNTVVVDQGRLNAVDTANSTAYVHTQTTPASTWVINHGLSYNPSVTIVSTNGDLVHGDVNYSGAQQITINFSAPFSGRVYLS